MALAAYERQRNMMALPGYEQDCAVAALLPPPPEMPGEILP